MTAGIDILMITYNRPDYTRLSLARLLATCDDSMRVWVWHNGDDAETLEAVHDHLAHPRLFRFHHSRENLRLRSPTNWLFANAGGRFLSKVDDDCLVPHGWAQTLSKAHAVNDSFGAIGCWRFFAEDFLAEAAARKIVAFEGGHRLMVNCWVEGSGYLMKRDCVDRAGLIGAHESFTQYCIRLARLGWVNGWYYPFLFQEHMDDPRSAHTLLKSDRDLEKWMPLSSRTFGANSLAEWQAALIADAHYLQRAPTDPAHYVGWRARLSNARRRLARLTAGGERLMGRPAL